LRSTVFSKPGAEIAQKRTILPTKTNTFPKCVGYLCKRTPDEGRDSEKTVNLNHREL